MTEWDMGDPMISVVGEHFCNPYPMEMIVKREVQNFSKDRYDIFDLSGNLLLQVEGHSWGFKRKRVMRDPAGFTILNMRQKVNAFKNKWEVYGGESKDKKDMLFVAQQRQAITLKTSFGVFLRDNLKRDICDFRASGGYSNTSFAVFKSNALIAGVTHNVSWGSFCKGKYNCSIKVNPEVDYAFIISLLVIIDDNENLC